METWYCFFPYCQATYVSLETHGHGHVHGQPQTSDWQKGYNQMAGHGITVRYERPLGSENHLLGRREEEEYGQNPFPNKGFSNHNNCSENIVESKTMESRTMMYSLGEI